ncbi:hypothetical protein H4R18_001579 [Coemansia javaensis]|uniref:Uncharacterized protein n=1 Tax=Coemansia javaensis TaxID=2761396 RepID=A0A9W8HK74_9FUNG|nr:hypothetical protein H4R18_001579 [Coemansia javaensis]
MSERASQKAPARDTTPPPGAGGSGDDDDTGRPRTRPGSPPGSPGLLGRVAESAARLAGAMPRLDPAQLSGAKSGEQREDGAAASRQWAADRDHGGGSAGPAEPTAAASFRAAARATSHQVSLAQGLDGRGVADFLAQGLPTAMGTGSIGGLSAGQRGPARPQGPHAATETTDPVAYLQGTSYAADMEGGGSPEPRASPPNLARSWSEHGASVLEEWQLNEAWDRAWMDTTWSSARPADKAPEAEPVAPSHKNLSHLLKPRI